ncbi:uncharacterized protein LOC131146402 isoform X2 [Malania oleifera]|uniref:uncharacterized protein LOC131146402 isoform X2 n=1 Tax=Malania oleifera TaxID=397392 RepID=UPI0025ADA6A1|nr:uncharacterized protein LOC131146402 isoform X2 [Malania oleifera]
MDPWEALDIDDSDLSSFLRPCKRPHHPPSPIKTTAAATRVSDPTDCSPPFLESAPIPPTQTLDPLPLHHSPEVATTSLRPIPGPAGAVQAAMHRKARNDRNFFTDDPIPTQEYIRRVVENGTCDDDDDFSRNPWLCAVDFLSRKGMVDGVAIGTPLSSIKKCSNADRIAQVVAIVKSCSPNGLGDFMVTLKDPTGTIGASVHHKVLAEGTFARDISVGSVLILQKVAVFSPSRSAHYLNITLSNLVKVISKDCRAPPDQNCPASIVKHAASGKCSGKTWLLPKTVPSSQGRAEDRMDDIRQSANLRWSGLSLNQIVNSNEAPGGSSYNSSSRNQNAARDMESILTRLDGSKGPIKARANKDIIDNEQRYADGRDKESERHQLGSIHCSDAAANLVVHTNIGEVGSINRVEQQRQPLVSKASIPEWTDEQLEALFGFDCENGDYLF